VTVCEDGVYNFYKFRLGGVSKDENRETESVDEQTLRMNRSLVDVTSFSPLKPPHTNDVNA